MSLRTSGRFLHCPNFISIFWSTGMPSGFNLWIQASLKWSSCSPYFSQGLDEERIRAAWEMLRSLRTGTRYQTKLTLSVSGIVAFQRREHQGHCVSETMTTEGRSEDALGFLIPNPFASIDSYKWSSWVPARRTRILGRTRNGFGTNADFIGCKGSSCRERGRHC